MIFLHKLDINPHLSIKPPAIGLAKETSVIAMARGLY